MRASYAAFRPTSFRRLRRAILLRFVRALRFAKSEIRTTVRFRRVVLRAFALTVRRVLFLAVFRLVALAFLILRPFEAVLLCLVVIRTSSPLIVQGGQYERNRLSLTPGISTSRYSRLIGSTSITSAVAVHFSFSAKRRSSFKTSRNTIRFAAFNRI